MAHEELAIGDVGTVPDLLRQKTAVTGHVFHGGCKLLGDISPSGRELVVCALAGQQRPCATDPGAIEGLAVGMFAVRVPLIPVPSWPARRVHLQGGINHLDSIEYARVVRGSKAESYECERIEVHHQRRWPGGFSRWAVLNRDETLTRRSGICLIGTRNAHVVAVDAVQPAQ